MRTRLCVILGVGVLVWSALGCDRPAASLSADQAAAANRRSKAFADKLYGAPANQQGDLLRRAAVGAAPPPKPGKPNP